MKKRFKETNSGAWIFISYSHRDLEKVRHIRTERERRGTIRGCSSPSA